MAETHEIRATFDRESITVYQAYSDAIADPPMADPPIALLRKADRASAKIKTE